MDITSNRAVLMPILHFKDVRTNKEIILAVKFEINYNNILKEVYMIQFVIEIKSILKNIIF